MFCMKGMTPDVFLRAVVTGLRRPSPATHLFLCVADHFEPDWKAGSTSRQRDRVARWVDGFPKFAADFVDDRGRPPQHTFFYPAEAYQADQIEQLTRLTRRGFGDIDVHLHHDGDTADRLREFLHQYVALLHDRHGLLSRDPQGQIRYGFIHGNWALDNSHPDQRWCGVNNELTILRETGCYADFTMPAAPHAAQTRMINSIYYAVDDPQRPKSHDRGTAARVGVQPPSDGLLMIQGPLLISRREPGRGWKPRLENGDLSNALLPSSQRLRAWRQASVGVLGKPEWLFIKLHAHGAQEANAAALLGEPMRETHRALRRLSAQGGPAYFYVTAREMAQLVRQAESGLPAPDFDQLDW